jgi:sugar lactone lactonase YvrE
MVTSRRQPASWKLRALGAGLAAALAALAGGCASAGKATAGASREYSFWPPAPDEPRIQFLRSYRFSSDVEPPRSGFDKLVFGTEQQVLPIERPFGVAMWQSRIYVCDITNPAVVVLDLVKQQTRLMAARGVERMVQPTAIAIAPDGMKYVADRRQARIFVFDGEDRQVSAFGQRGLAPAGLAVHDGELYVADLESQTVLVFDRLTGEPRRTIGGPGGEAGRFISPVGVAVDAGGDVYVTDAIRGRLQKFSPTGELLLSVGEIADSPGNFVRPKQVAVDQEGVVYVVDAAFQNVQMFNPQGQLLMFFGSAGAHPGSMSLPAGIADADGDLGLFSADIHPAFEAQRLLLVTNQYGLNKVSVYAMGRLRAGKTIADIAPYAADVRPREQPPEAAVVLPPAAPPESPTAPDQEPAEPEEP